MKIYINERTIDQQAETQNEAMAILADIAKLVLKSRPIAYEGKAYRTRCFAEREIISGATVKSVLVASVAKQSKDDELKRKLILQTLLTRPYTSNHHLSAGDAINDQQGTCLKESCFDDAAQSLSGSLLISAKHPRHTDMVIRYKSSIFGEKFSHNINSEESLDAITWVFEHNPKHGKKPRKTAGIEISEMTLTTEQAQATLSNGIKVKSKIYGYYENNWYQFHCHHSNKYHGFKITIKESSRDHMAALAKLTELDFKNNCGQIFLSPT